MSLLITPSTETRVNTTTASELVQPTVAPLSDGGYAVTWMSGIWAPASGQDGSGYGIYAQRYDRKRQHGRERDPRQHHDGKRPGLSFKSANKVLHLFLAPAIAQ
jgi:hypothetical protein